MADVTANIDKLTETWAPRLRDAFLQAIVAIRDDVVIARVVAALQRGDVDAAVREVSLDPLQFRGLEDAVAGAHADGGAALVSRLPATTGPAGHRLVVLFDARNTRAEAWVRNNSSELVTQVVADQKIAIRNHLQAGLASGTNPRTVALDLVGRVNPQTGKREGGVIGLTSSQDGWARAYAAELASGDRAALRRALRDKRFDKAVLKAIAKGEPLSPDLITKMVTAYRSRALKYRADAIARTEALSALNHSQVEAMQQAIEKGHVQAQYVTKRWRSAADKRVRHSHRVLNNVRVPFSSKFRAESGATLAYPGDPEGGAAEVVNCRCHMSINVDHISALAAQEAA